MTTLSTLHPVAKKRHLCDTCGAPIVPGERYVRQAGVGDDGFWTWKGCGPCYDLTPIVWEAAGSPYEGVGEEDFVEWARDHTDDPDHCDAAVAFLARKQAAHDAWVARMDAAHGKGLW